MGIGNAFTLQYDVIKHDKKIILYNIYCLSVLESLPFQKFTEHHVNNLMFFRPCIIE